MGTELCSQATATNRVLNIALTWPFAISVALLLLNDFWFKAAWPGLVSGKLSDFAGISLLALLLLAAAPRHREKIFIGMAVAFTYWKSPFSQPLIDTVNPLLPVAIGRTVDYSDLVSLIVVPACAFVVAHPERFAIRGQLLRRLLLPPLFLASIFGVMATSLVRLPFEYEFQMEDTSVELDKTRLADAIRQFATDQDMECRECSDVNTRGDYVGYGLDLHYVFENSRTLAIHLVAMAGGMYGPSPDKVAEKTMRKLHKRLRTIHPDIRLERVAH